MRSAKRHSDEHGARPNPAPYAVDAGLITFAEQLNTVSFAYIVQRDERINGFDQFRASLSEALRTNSLADVGGSKMTLKQMIEISRTAAS